MRLKAITSALLISSLLTHSCLPAYAHLTTVTQAEENIEILKRGSLKTSQEFQADPNKTAAGCLIYAKRNGKIEILLGQRDDGNTYCNLGGKSDTADETLDKTAARESAEESLNIYCPHPEFLKRSPFVDLFTQETESSLLYRMYFIEQEHIESDQLNDRLHNAHQFNFSSHHQEYKNFTWVLAEDLLNAISKGEETFISSSDNEEITLFDPLFQILRTETSINLLTHLVTHNTIPLIPKKTDVLLKNRLHLKGILGTGNLEKKNWLLELKNSSPLSPFNQKAFKTNHVALNEDAFGKKEVTYRMGDKIHSVALDEDKNRKIFGMAVAAKAAANLEIKKKSKEIEAKHVDFQTLSPQLPLQEIKPEQSFSLSDLLLQAQLGADYIIPADQNDPILQRQADIANLKKYHEKYSKVEGELKREAHPLESDFERLAEIFEIERKHSSWIALHHASKPEIKYLWSTMTAFRELLTGSPVEPGTNPGMRATDIFFKNITTMGQDLALNGTDDYEKGNANRRLSANMAITPGLTTTHTSSSSVEYFFNSHSVRAPMAMKRFEEAAQLIGMIDTSYLPYQSLYEQLFGFSSKDVPNSAWTVLLINPEEVNSYSYSAIGGGDPFHPDYQHRNPSTPFAVTKTIYERAKEDLKATIIERDEIKKIGHSIAEVRLLLHPNLMFDSTKIKVFSLDRFPLTTVQQQKFQTHLRTLMIYDLGHWLSQHTQIIPDSLQDTSKLKQLYSYAYKGVTGKDVQERQSLDAFPHLVRNGHLEGVKVFFATHPNLINDLNIKPKELADMALNSGNKELLSFTIEEVLNIPVSALYSSKDIATIALKEFGEDSLSETSKYLFKNFDMQSIDEELRKTKVKHVITHFPAKDIEFFHKYIYPISEDLMDTVIEELWNQNSFPTSTEIIKSLDCPLFPKISLLEKHFYQYLSTKGKGQKVYSMAWNIMSEIGKDKNLSLLEKLPTSGIPLFFCIPFFGYDRSMKPLLDNISDILTHTNKEGLNIIQFYQQQYLEGVIAHLSFWEFYDTFLKPELISKNIDIISVSYKPYFEEFGPGAVTIYNVSDINNSPFSDVEFLAWHETYKAALAADSWQQVLSAFKSIPSPNMLLKYSGKNPADSFYNRQRILPSPVTLEKEEINALTESLEKAFQSGKYSSVMALIDQTFASNYNYNQVYFAFKDVFEKHSPSMSVLKKEIEEKNLPTPEILNLLNYPNYFLDAIKDGKITRKNFESLEGCSIFIDKNLPLLEKILPVLYSDLDQLANAVNKSVYNLGTAFFHSAFSSAPLQEGVIDLLFKLCGPYNILNKLSQSEFQSFMHYFPEDKQSELLKHYPEIFTYCDNSKNFLEVCFDIGNPINWTIDLVTKNFKVLTETNDSDTGLPFIFILLFESYDNKELIEQIITKYPDLLNFVTKDGLTPMDIYASHMSDAEDREEFKYFKKIFTKNSH